MTRGKRGRPMTGRLSPASRLAGVPPFVSARPADGLCVFPTPQTSGTTVELTSGHGLVCAGRPDGKLPRDQKLC
jgi:hypothetical protein